MNVNKVIVVGRLTRDPEGKVLPSGQPVTTFSLATSSAYKDRDGNEQEDTEYHDIVVWGKSAENCARYLVKGQLASVEGHLKTRSWDHEGVKHYRTEIIADRVQFGPSAEKSAHRDSDTSIVPDPQTPEYPEDEINPEDIPF